MAFADPLTVSIGNTDKQLVRVDSGRGASEYRLVEPTQSFQMFIRSQELKIEKDGRRKYRHNISLRQTVFATGTEPEITRDCSVSLIRYASDDIAAINGVFAGVGALCTMATAAKLNNFES